MSLSISIFFDHIEKIVSELHNGIKWKSFDKIKAEFEKLSEFLVYLKSHFSQEFAETTFA